jgi:hypothetical protein
MMTITNVVNIAIAMPIPIAPAPITKNIITNILSHSPLPPANSAKVKKTMPKIMTTAAGI